MGAIRAALVDAVIAALPVALVYFSGWAYLTSYLGYFGLDATQIEVSFTTVLVYAFIPLQAPWVLCTMAAIFLFGFLAFLAETYAGGTSIFWRVASAGIGLFALVGVVYLLFAIKDAAAESAKNMVDKVWAGDKSQTVMTLNDAQKGSVVGLYNACRDQNRLRQVIGLSNQMILLCRSAVDECDRGTVFAISNDGRLIFKADKIRGDFDVKEICSD